MVRNGRSNVTNLGDSPRRSKLDGEADDLPHRIRGTKKPDLHSKSKKVIDDGLPYLRREPFAWGMDPCPLRIRGLRRIALHRGLVRPGSRTES